MRKLRLDQRLDKFLQTGPLLECYELLKGKNVCAWIDTVKPRVFALFTFGDLGPFQNLLYNSDVRQLQAGHWGIYPYCGNEEQRIYPFQDKYKHGDDSHEFCHEPKEIRRLPEEGAVSLLGVPAFLNGQDKCGTFDWKICLEEDALKLAATGPAQPTGFMVHLYPLYDYAALDGKMWPLCYRVGGWGEAKVLTLIDSRNRMPRLRLSAPGGKLRVRSSQDIERGAAYRLDVESIHHGSEAQLTLELLSNPMQATRPLPTVPDPKTALLTMAEGVCTAVKEMARTWPAVAGMIPGSYRLDSCEPYLREESEAVCQYMPRVAMLMAAASLETGDRRYVDVMANAMEKYLSFSRFLPDGRIAYVPRLRPDGSTDESGLGPRPSDYAIAARGWLYCADAYRGLKLAEQAQHALRRAKELGSALALLQGEDGSFSSVYNLRDPRWLKPGVAVNNVSWVLWQLYERLQEAGDPAAEKIRRCARAYVSFELDKRLGPSPLRVPGPGATESIPMYHDDFMTLACYLLTRHMDTGESKWLELAKQASACAFFAASFFYIDQPEAFGFVISPGALPLWLGGVPNTMGKGGMQDKSGNEVHLALARRFGAPLSEAALEWSWHSRIAWSLEPSGGMNGMDMRVPGYRYRNAEWTEELNWGGVGFAAHLLINAQDGAKPKEA